MLLVALCLGQTTGVEDQLVKKLVEDSVEAINEWRPRLLRGLSEESYSYSYTPDAPAPRLRPSQGTPSHRVSVSPLLTSMGIINWIVSISNAGDNYTLAWHRNIGPLRSTLATVATNAIVVLVNAVDNSDVRTLHNGDVVIDPTTLNLSASNVRADVGTDVLRVIFSLEESGVIVVEATESSVPPYALFGDTSGDYYAGSFQYDMSYILTATPYYLEEGSLVAGIPLTVTFGLRSGKILQKKKELGWYQIPTTEL